MRHWIVLIFALAFGCSTQDGKNENDSSTDKPLVERISLKDLNGNSIELSDLKGKVIFLNFWATWCKPCVKEMPSIDKASELLKNEPVVFLAASDEEVEKIKKFVSKLSYRFQFVHSATSVFDLDIKALPTTIIILSEGKIVVNEIGCRDWSSKKNIELIKKFISPAHE